MAVAQAYGFEVDEVPITFRPRFARSTVASSRLVEFAADLRRIRRKIRNVARAEMQHDQDAWASRSARMRGQPAEVGSEFGAVDELG